MTRVRFGGSIVIALSVLVIASSPSTATHQAPARVAKSGDATVGIHVGAQTRDGFIDIDQGILDSIKDVQGELRKNRAFRVVKVPEDATLHLTIVRRAVSGTAVGVALPLYPGGSIVVPIHGHVVEALLKFGDYERPFLAEDREDGTWNRCAEILAKDIATWVTANRQKLQ
jgi:hypothetical protein